MVDTGATGVALSYEDAETAGIYVKDSDFTHQSSTANGIAQIALVNIDRISIGDITVRNVQGMVLDRGKLKGTLLGMSFLSRLSRVDMRQGTLVYTTKTHGLNETSGDLLACIRGASGTGSHTGPPPPYQCTWHGERVGLRESSQHTARASALTLVNTRGRASA